MVCEYPYVEDCSKTIAEQLGLLFSIFQYLNLSITFLAFLYAFVLLILSFMKLKVGEFGHIRVYYGIFTILQLGNLLFAGNLMGGNDYPVYTWRVAWIMCVVNALNAFYVYS